MPTDITSIRLPPTDSSIINHFIDDGDFKSKSEFIRYAVKKTINEMMLQKIQLKIDSENPITRNALEDIQKEIKDIRKDLWNDGFTKKV